jgi:hypothetical protein
MGDLLSVVAMTHSPRSFWNNQAGTPNLAGQLRASSPSCGGSVVSGAMVDEPYTARVELGSTRAEYDNAFHPAKSFMPVVVLMAGGILISQSLKLLDHRLAHWKSTQLEL